MTPYRGVQLLQLAAGEFFYHKLFFGKSVVEQLFLRADTEFSTAAALELSKAALDISARVEYGRFPGGLIINNSELLSS